MAIHFHELPEHLFDKRLQPYIGRLNRELRDLFSLEGTIRQPISAAASSDLSIQRSEGYQVHVSRITPDVSLVVSGSSSIIGAPNFTFGTANAIGTTNTVVSVNSAIALFDTNPPENLSGTSSVGTAEFAARRDHVHLFPTSLRSTANASTLALTDDGSNQTLTGSLGDLTIAPTGGDLFVTGNLDVSAHIAVGALASPQSDAVLYATESFTHTSGDKYGEYVEVTESPASASSGTLRGLLFLSNISGAGNITGSAFGIVGSIQKSGANTINNTYAIAGTHNFSGGTIVSAYNLFSGSPAISSGAITTGYGVYHQGWVSANVTNKWAFYAADDSSYFGGMVKLAPQTGANADVHLNLVDKTADPPSPVTGDLWRNGKAIKFNDGTNTTNLLTTLRSATTGYTLALTDDGTDMTLTGSLGNINLAPSGHLVVAAGSAQNQVISVQITPGSGTARGIVSSLFNGTPTGDVTCWDASVSGFAGVFPNNMELAGFRSSSFSITPSSGSGTGLEAYCAHLLTPRIQNTTGTWAQVAGLYIEAQGGALSGAPNIPIAAGLIVEPSETTSADSYGIYVKEGSPIFSENPTNRYGIRIGTMSPGGSPAKWGLYVDTDPCKFMAVGYNIEEKTSGYAADDNDHVITCDASGGAFTVTLPALSAARTGRVYHIKKIDSSANAITIDGDSAETIDGATTASITTQYDSIMIVAGATEWHII